MKQSLLTILAFIRQRGYIKERTYYMAKNMQSSQMTNAIQNEQPLQSRIFIRRTFGEQSLLELYSDYIAEKVREKMRDTKPMRSTP